MQPEPLIRAAMNNLGLGHGVTAEDVLAFGWDQKTNGGTFFLTGTYDDGGPVKFTVYGHTLDALFEEFVLRSFDRH